MTGRRSIARWAFVLSVIAIAMVAATGLVLACGPFLTDLITINSKGPAYVDPYRRGELGVIKPTFYPRYLIQAYRVFNNRPAVPAGATWRWWEDADPGASPIPARPDEWVAEVERRQPTLSNEQRYRLRNSWRAFANYQSFHNCLDDAYVSAVRTLDERVRRRGSASREVREWFDGQVAVFENCSGGDLVLPAAAPPWADSLLQADRRYQVAAAHFYAMRYDEAQTRFRAIGEDAASPWRPYGRYLAARAAIRLATLGEGGNAAGLYAAAEGDLKAVLGDATARMLHGSAQGLLGFIAVRARPVDRFRELTRTLAESPAPTHQDFIDYLALFDRGAGGAGHDMNEWLVAMQSTSGEAAARAIDRWRQTRSLHWLVAALWRVAPSHAAAPELLMAAADVRRDSPAFPTVAVLRARLLIQSGDRASARRWLASLPVATAPGINAETLNLLRGARLMVADTFDEFIDNAARTVILDSFDQPVFDEDAAFVLNELFPLDRLADTALSVRLPARLRTRAAVAAFARAVVLRRPETALRVAPVLEELAPQLRTDLRRYTAAANETDRHRAGVLLVLRTPGMHGFVRVLDNDATYKVMEPARRFDLTGFRPGGWWCWIDASHRSAVTDVLYGGQKVSTPVFLSEAERAGAAAEMTAFRAAGPAREFLTREALAWARAAPSDLDAAEALARAVEGWRRTCGASLSDPSLPRVAFTMLHRQFPKSEWARRTPYWYQ
jgi:hypothetical protein